MTELTEEEIHGPDQGSFPNTCDRCNYDSHTCPGCGEWLHHGTVVCGRCKRELEGERL